MLQNKAASQTHQVHLGPDDIRIIVDSLNICKDNPPADGMQFVLGRTFKIHNMIGALLAAAGEGQTAVTVTFQERNEVEG